MLWLGTVGVPYGALIAIIILEWLVSNPTFNEGVMDVGVNACILGMGVTGALFSTREIGQKIGVEGFAIAIIILFLDLILVGICLHLRKNATTVGYGRALLALVLGLLSLGINSGIVVFGGPANHG